MEFQRERVYTALNADELRAGDKVIVDYDIAHLKEQVKLGVFYLPIKKINAEDITCRFNVGDGNDYPLAYLVERAENCTNCIENDRGCTAMGNDKLAHCWNWKPITKQKAEKHYRPFRDTLDLIKFWYEKTEEPPKTDADCLLMPHIWVREKGCEKSADLITCYGSKGITVRGKGMSFDTLFTMFEFLDGTPCGVEE